MPRQLLVRAPKGDNKVTALPYDTSLLSVRYNMPDEKDIEVMGGVRQYAPGPALVACGHGLFQQSPTDMRTALSMVRDASELLTNLLEGGHSLIAGRLAGALPVMTCGNPIRSIQDRRLSCPAGNAPLTLTACA